MVAVIEDDLAMRNSIERLLRASGFQTSAFACSDDFLNSKSAATADVLVLDIHLAGTSGLELQQRLLARGSKCPVIFITAHDEEVTRQQAVGLGCVAYLLKPFEPHQLIEAVKRGSLS